MKLTKKELSVTIRHLSADISYGEGGSFNKEGKNGEWPFDEKEAEIARSAITKLLKLYNELSVKN